MPRCAWVNKTQTFQKIADVLISLAMIKSAACIQIRTSLASWEKKIWRAEVTLFLAAHQKTYSMNVLHLELTGVKKNQFYIYITSWLCCDHKLSWVHLWSAIMIISCTYLKKNTKVSTFAFPKDICLTKVLSLPSNRTCSASKEARAESPSADLVGR